METIIKIEDKEVRLSNNVAWTMEYRDQFGKDPLETILPLANTLIETTAIIINNGGMSVDENGKKALHAEAIAEALEGRSFDITLPLMQMGFVDAVVNVTWAMAKACCGCWRMASISAAHPAVSVWGHMTKAGDLCGAI